MKEKGPSLTMVRISAVVFIVSLITFIASSFYLIARVGWFTAPLVADVRADGTGFAEEDGEQVVFRGVGIMPPIYLENRGVDFAKYIAEAKAWGANTIRLPIYPVIYYGWENVLPWDDIDKTIQQAELNGLMVILDFHSVGFPPEETYHTEWTGEHTEDIFYYRNDWLIGFWENASERYRDENTVVAYEIFNEVKWAENDNLEVSWLLWKAFAEENIISRIRQNDPDKLLIVSGVWYARDLSWCEKYPIEDNNLAYKRTSYWEWNPAAEYENKLPVVFAETDELPLKALEERGASWIAYCFSADWAPNLLLDYENFTPSQYGVAVKGYLQGEPPALCFVELMLVTYAVSGVLALISGSFLLTSLGLLPDYRWWVEWWTAKVKSRSRKK